MTDNNATPPSPGSPTPGSPKPWPPKPWPAAPNSEQSASAAHVEGDSSAGSYAAESSSDGEPVSSVFNGGHREIGRGAGASVTSGEETVGYKRPPIATRFKPGQSGNPKGRPKGRQNLKLDLQAELSETILIREGERQIRITKQRAMVKSTVARAIKGDARAQAKAFELLLRAFGIDDEIHNETVAAPDDLEILKGFLDRNKGEAP